MNRIIPRQAGYSDWMAENGKLEKVLGAGAGWARMLAAAVRRRGGRAQPGVAATDTGPMTGSMPGIREYIRTTLPTLRMFSDVYHRAEVRGLNNIPAEGPCCSWATTPAAR